MFVGPCSCLISDRLANMFYECSIDEYNLRKYTPEYSIKLLQHALSLSNNSIDKEEINSKIILFEKRTDKKTDEKQSEEKIPNGCAAFICIYILIQLILIIISLVTKK